MVSIKSLIKFDTSNKNRMKLRYLFSTFFMAGILLSSSAQVHLRISGLSRFPVSPTDTAYESVTYDSIQIQVLNIGNTPLNSDNISILIVGNPAGGVDILYEDTAALYNIQSGTSANINASGYVFRPTHFDDGDNIVVVWPAARFTPYIADSLTFHIYYVSLLASINLQGNDQIVISPNPVNDYIALEIPSNLEVKQVRIIDLFGRSIVTFKDGINYIPTSNWNSGLYILQYTDKFGKLINKRLIKN